MADRPLVATYRLQLRKELPLSAAGDLVPYLQRLGISHLYLSPITMARPGSTHGYDVADPLRVTPELGGEPAWRELVRTLHARGMGVVLDVVPNHMGIGPANPYWWDVLTHGSASRWAHWFDIDWTPARRAGRGRVLLPVLGDELSAVLDRGEIKLAWEDGSAVLRYFDHRFPVDPATLPARAGAPDIDQWNSGPDAAERLGALLDAQAYRLADWRRGARDLNYRRFFDVNELVALRMEDPRVFEETHALILEWVADGSVDALRIDHVDGLLDPLGYLERLRAEVAARRGPGFPLFVEKILTGSEQLRRAWPVQGTTGYDFLNHLEGAFVEPAGFQGIESFYRRFRGMRAGAPDFAEVARRAKGAALERGLRPDLRRLARLLEPMARRDPRGSGASRSALERALAQLISCADVYRGYIRPVASPVDETDAEIIGSARARALLVPAAAGPLIELIADVLLGQLPAPSVPDEEARLAFVGRFQQLCAPAAAKGVEDTALYRYAPLGSLAEVGGQPDRPLGESRERLHAANAERQAHWPLGLLAVTTHDTKRSGDVRARLDVLSEIPAEWARRVRRWHALNREHAHRVGRLRVPDAHGEYVFYQTLVGVWPLGGRADDAPAMAALCERVQEYMRKAVREAKRHTSWRTPDVAFEDATAEFVASAMDPARSLPFLRDVEAWVVPVARAGLWNALAGTLVHCAAPGTPDIYQGDELWNFAVVDPDNRRPVDYAVAEAAAPPAEAGEEWLRDVVAHPDDGRIKMYVVQRALAARREMPAAFSGGYEPLACGGSRGRHLLAFARGGRRDQAAVVIVPRLSIGVGGGERAPIGADVWGDTTVQLPERLQGYGWRCALGGYTIHDDGAGALPVHRALQAFPVALLLPAGAP